MESGEDVSNLNRLEDVDALPSIPSTSSYTIHKSSIDHERFGGQVLRCRPEWGRRVPRGLRKFRKVLAPKKKTTQLEARRIDPAAAAAAAAAQCRVLQHKFPLSLSGQTLLVENLEIFVFITIFVHLSFIEFILSGNLGELRNH